MGALGCGFLRGGLGSVREGGRIGGRSECGAFEGDKRRTATSSSAKIRRFADSSTPRSAPSRPSELYSTC